MNSSVLWFTSMLMATATTVLGCSGGDVPSVDCSRVAQSGDTNITCGDNNGGTAGSGDGGGGKTPAPIVLQAGCFQDVTVCPTAYPLSWVIEHCSIAYACPLRNPDAGPDQLICLRYIEDECVDKYTN